MKIAFFSEQDPRLPRPFLADSHNLMGNVGLNFGNLAFWYGASNIPKDEIDFFGWNTAPEDMKPCDLIMIPAANWLSNTTNFGFLADIIEYVNKPVVILGLGIQSNKGIDDIRLTEGTTRFLHSVAARTPKILVRGELTKEFLMNLGIENVIVGGCPSLFINHTLDLGKKIQRKINGLKERNGLKIAIHALNYGEHELRRVERLLFSLASHYNSDYIMQSPHSVVKVLLDEELAEKDVNSLAQLNNFLAPNISYDEFIKELKKRTSFFNNINSWVLRLRQMNCALNTRIHGALLSIAAEIPAVCIYHDIRTQELSQSTLIPSIGVRDLQCWDTDIYELFRICSFDGSAFDANRAAKAALLRDILEELGVTVQEKILRIASST